MKSIGRRIKKTRQVRGLTQQELGVSIGFSKENARIRISQYEANDRMPRKDIVDKLAEVLTVDPLYLTTPVEYSSHELMHIFFTLESEYGMRIVDVNGEPHLKFSIASSGRLLCNLSEWLCEYMKLLNNKISKQEYDEWRYTYTHETKDDAQ